MLNKWVGASSRKINRNPNSGVGGMELSYDLLLVNDMLNKWGGASSRKMNRNPNFGVSGMEFSYECYL